MKINNLTHCLRWQHRPNLTLNSHCYPNPLLLSPQDCIGESGVGVRVLPAYMSFGIGTLNLFTAVRFEAANFNGLPPSQSPKSLPHLSLTKPSWVVRTESNVRKKRRKKPDPHCVVCEGSGRVDCHHCHGKGRTNEVHLEMLPKGEWPKWCSTCGGSGLGYCSRCLGTGEYRYIMGFQFMNIENNQSQENKS